jgi:hypothetical protein
MSGNLEDFLRQAAQRRQQRGGVQDTQAQRPPVRKAERTRQVVEAEVVEPIDEGESVSRRVTLPSPVSKPHSVPTITSHATPSQQVDTADERMAKHVQDFLVHPVSQFSNESVATKDAIAAEIVPVQPMSQITSQTEAQFRPAHLHPMVAMLRSPDTLKAAFIISELFARKF